MYERIKLGFKVEITSLPISAIVPRHKVSERVQKGVKYKRIMTSIATFGIVEPLIVSPLSDREDTYILMDGHARFEIVRSLGHAAVDCIISLDDEGYSYNKRISHLATIQEHYMIVRALQGGASREKLSAALNLDIKRIEQRRTMLDGISPEVVELLKDRPNVTTGIFQVIKKMKPPRQLAVITMMLSVNNLSRSYALALLAGTRPTDLKDGSQGKRSLGLTAEQMARMERESETLQSDFKAVEARHGDDVMNLMIGCGYVAKLLRNAEIERYLEKREAGLVEQLRSIISTTSPDRDWPQMVS